MDGTGPEADFERARLLAAQGRWDLAAERLQAVLGRDPDFAPAHALLAQAWLARGDPDAALRSAQQAVGLAPDMAFAHRGLAVVHLERGELDDALAAAERAIERAPGDADLHGLRAQVLLLEKRWPEALAAAEAGLRLDPEHTDCLNLRSVALVRLGRGAEARDTLDASLRHDPDNPYTHQARGFALLHAGDARAALHHFQEALRRDPTLDTARAGLVESLKARNPVYRLLLGWMLWLDRFSAGRQLQILFGVWLAQFVVGRSLRASGHEDAATVVGYAWLGVVLFTFCTNPLFNLLLLLHPVGRHALEPRARRDAVLLGGAVAACAGVLLHAWSGAAAWSRLGWPIGLLFLLPVAGIGLFGDGWGRRVLQVYCLAVVATFVWWAFWTERLLEEFSDAIRRDPALAATLLEQDPDWQDNRWLRQALLASIALSTWFVVLAPKGRPRRRARPGRPGR